MMQKLFFENSKGQKLCGILEESNESKEEIVIMVHGFSSSKNGHSTRNLAAELTNRCMDFFNIDLGGCGESEGNFAEQTISSSVDDLNAAIDFVKVKGYKKINLFGSSAGGLTVMATALSHPEINKVGAKAPPSDYPSQRLEKNGKKFMDEWKEKGYTYKVKNDGTKLRINYSFIEDAKKWVMYDKIKDIKCPILIIHGDADEMVPIGYSKKLDKNSTNLKLIILEGADHALKINGDASLSTKMFADWFEDKEVN